MPHPTLADWLSASLTSEGASVGSKELERWASDRYNIRKERSSRVAFKWWRSEEEHCGDKVTKTGL